MPKYKITGTSMEFFSLSLAIQNLILVRQENADRALQFKIVPVET